MYGLIIGARRDDPARCKEAEEEGFPEAALMAAIRALAPTLVNLGAIVFSNRGFFPVVPTCCGCCPKEGAGDPDSDAPTPGVPARPFAVPPATTPAPGVPARLAPEALPPEPPPLKSANKGCIVPPSPPFFAELSLACPPAIEPTPLK